MNFPNLQALRATQLSVMDDVCNLIHVAHVTGTVVRSSIASGAACGIEFLDGVEDSGRRDILAGFDIVLRLPITLLVINGDEVELVSKGGFSLSGTYQVVSPPDYSSSAQKFKLKRVRS